MKAAFDLLQLREERKYWKSVELSCLSDSQKNKYLNRKKAVDMYIEGYTTQQIMTATNLKGKSEAKRLLQKCLTVDEFGSYLGYSALIVYKHVKTNYERKNVPTVFTANNSSTGMFSLLLTDYPEIKQYLELLIYGRDKTVLEKNISVKTIHQLFLKKCKQIGIKEYEYPFCVKSKGYRSLNYYIKNLMFNNPSKIASRLSKDAYEKMTTTGKEQCILLPDIRPFSVVQIDGHKIDCIATIEITTPKGDKETKTIQRFWLLTLIDVATRAILGYHLTVESAYDRFDVLKCIENAIKPKKLMKFTIPGLEYPDNTGYHSIALPESEWAVFDELMLDNALAHLSKDVIKQVTIGLNATLNFGPVASPERRGIVERFYQTIESRGFHRMPSTTGTGINDPRRRNAEKDAIKYCIKFEHIVELTEILIAQYNNTPHNANNGFTPLEVMEQRMAKGVLPNYLEEEKRDKFMLNYITVTRKIRGKLGTGRRPYVSFEGAEYRSEVLSQAFQFVGHKLILKFDSNDIRTCKAFFEDGTEFCDLYVVGQWRNQAHTIDQRRAANKLLNDKKLKGNNFIDPMLSYDKFLIAEAESTKRARNKLATRKLTQKNNDSESNNNSFSNYKIVDGNGIQKEEDVFSLEELEMRFQDIDNIIHYN